MLELIRRNSVVHDPEQMEFERGELPEALELFPTECSEEGLQGYTTSMLTFEVIRLFLCLLVGTYLIT